MIKILVPLSWLPIRFGDEQYADFFVCCWKQFNRFTRDVMSPKIYRAGGTKEGDKGDKCPDFERILAKPVC